MSIKRIAYVLWASIISLNAFGGQGRVDGYPNLWNIKIGGATNNVNQIMSDVHVNGPQGGGLLMYSAGSIGGGSSSSGSFDSITAKLLQDSTLNVIDSSSVNTIKRCYYSTPIATAIGAPYDNIEQILMYQTTGSFPSFYYESWTNLNTGATIYERFKNNTSTGTIPSVGTEVLPCERNKTEYRQLVYQKLSNGYFADIASSDYPNQYRLDINNLVIGITEFTTIDWGDGMTEDLAGGVAASHVYSSKGSYNVVITWGDQWNRFFIRFTNRFKDEATNYIYTVPSYDYSPLYEYTNLVAQSVYYTPMGSITPVSPTGIIITPEQYKRETSENEYLANPYAQKVNKVIGYSSLAVGSTDNLKGIVENYLASQEGIASTLAYAKKITITNIDVDAWTIMHIGNASVTDRHTPYGLKEGYTFYQEGRLYRLDEIFILNDSSSPRDLEFSFEIEY